jgi:hypothetical protein
MQRLSTIFFTWPATGRAEHHGRAMVGGYGAKSCSTVHQTPVRFFLHDLGYEREPIYSLAVVKMIERRPATRRRLRQSSMAAGAASGGALAPWFAPAVVVQAGAPPPTVELTRNAKARRINGGSLLGGGGSVSC